MLSQHIRLFFQILFQLFINFLWHKYICIKYTVYKIEKKTKDGYIPSWRIEKKYYWDIDQLWLEYLYNDLYTYINKQFIDISMQNWFVKWIFQNLNHYQLNSVSNVKYPKQEQSTQGTYDFEKGLCFELCSQKHSTLRAL
jgi:hypothetical protein